MFSVRNNLIFKTNTQLIKQGCDSGKFACGIFLDSQKAFDTINHDIHLKNCTMEYVIAHVLYKQ